MYFSDFTGLGLKGHQHFDFVDVYLDSDNLLFLDPCLIELTDDCWGKTAAAIMRSFFNELYVAYRDRDSTRKYELFSHAGEQNATKLGYGDGRNGKGKTAWGLLDSLRDLDRFVHTIPTIGRAQDIAVLIDGFAEDCMSDLLTNILHDHLNQYTAEQMRQIGRDPDCELPFWTWEVQSRTWIEVLRPCWIYEGKELLLVPKRIVRKNFLFGAHQYLKSVITEHYMREHGVVGMMKKDVYENMRRADEHWEYRQVIEYSEEYPDALNYYHDRMYSFYDRKHGRMSDEDLDIAIYRQVMSDIA